MRSVIDVSKVGVNRQTVILVGGGGASPCTFGLDHSKPFIEVAEHPFLEHLVRHSTRFRITDVLQLAGHGGEVIRDAGHDRSPFGFGARARVLIEPGPMGTGGASAFAVDALDEIFLAANGDSLFEADLCAFLTRSRADGHSGHLLLREIDASARYGTVRPNAAGRVTAFDEKRDDTGCQSIDAVVHLLRAVDLQRVAPSPLFA